MLIGNAALFGFRMFFSNVAQAFLPSAEALQRYIFVKPCKEFELEAVKLLFASKATIWVI